MTQRTRYVDSGGAEDICRRLDLVMKDAAATKRDPAKANVQVVLSLNRNALRSVPEGVLEKWIRKSLIDAVVAAVLAEKERVRQRN